MNVPADLLARYGIDVPVLRAEESAAGWTLYLYGGRVVRHRTGAAPRPAPKPARHDDLTAAPGIGRQTARALHRQGIHTRAQLARALEEGALDGLLPARTRQGLERWLAPSQPEEETHP